MALYLVPDFAVDAVLQDLQGGKYLVFPDYVVVVVLQDEEEVFCDDPMFCFVVVENSVLKNDNLFGLAFLLHSGRILG